MKMFFIVSAFFLWAATGVAQVSLKAQPGYNSPPRIIYASGARIATPVAVTVDNPVQTSGVFVIKCTNAHSASPSVVFTIDAYDSAAAAYVNLLTSAAITGVGTTLLTINLGAVATANVSVNRSLPRQLRLTATHADADTITYSLGAWFFP